MIQNGLSSSSPVWASPGELRRAERRGQRTAATGGIVLILGLVGGVMLMDRVMPASAEAAEQAMGLPTTY